MTWHILCPACGRTVHIDNIISDFLGDLALTDRVLCQDCSRAPEATLAALAGDDWIDPWGDCNDDDGNDRVQT